MDNQAFIKLGPTVTHSWLAHEIPQDIVSFWEFTRDDSSCFVDNAQRAINRKLSFNREQKYLQRANGM